MAARSLRGIDPRAVIQAMLAAYCLGAAALKVLGPGREAWAGLGVPRPLVWAMAGVQVLAAILLLGSRRVRLGAGLAALEVVLAAAIAVLGGAGGALSVGVAFAVAAAALTVARAPATLGGKEARGSQRIALDVPVVVRDAGNAGPREEAPWRRAVLSWFEE